MAWYPQLEEHMRAINLSSPESAFTQTIVPYLVGVWLDDYERRAPQGEVIETTHGEFHYLFDISAQRLIAAWGVSQGRQGQARDASRMRGHPQSAGPLYHRGHAIPHTLGGPTDINLVSQLGRINTVSFRPLEKRAVATPGSFYFTYWIYPVTPRGEVRPTQVPNGVDQGLLVPGQRPEVLAHGN